ncbi:MAG: hypothetical protein PHQ40_17265 [Anaerolineaceae bacterium]|nr:hypothetical protein [Anaerolineaceae bacterium]
MLEKAIEDYLIAQCNTHHGVAWKLPSQWYRHIPDRLVLLPGARIAFVELKRPGEKPRPGQIRMAHFIRSLGFICVSIDTKEKVDSFIKNLLDGDEEL